MALTIGNDCSPKPLLLFLKLKAILKLMFKSSLLEKLYIEDIYFFSVNTKYISSNVLKISEISRVRSTSEIADIFNT